MPFDRNLLAKPLRRSATLTVADAEKRTVELSFSSDVELERWPGFVEKLSHDKGCVDLSRLESGASLLFNHDWDAPIGVVERAWVDGNKGRAIVRFGNSARAKETFADVQDGILTNVSVGYRIEDFKESKRDKSTLIEATRWQPYEISIVTVPADVTVGVGRDASSTFSQPNTPPNTMNRAEIIAALKKRGITVPENATDAELMSLLERSLVTPGDDKASGTNSERSRVKEIIEIGEKYKCSDLARSFVAEGKSVADFQRAALEEVAKAGKALRQGTGDLGLSDKEVRQFSVVKLLRAITAEPGERARAMDEARFELEASAAAADKMTYRSVKGTVIPAEVLRQAFGQRDIISTAGKAGVGYTGNGSNLIAQQFLGDSFIEILRNKSAVLGLGTKLAGLLGTVDIPKQVGAATAYWIGEDDAAPDTDIKFGQVALRARTLAAKGQITRKMLMQPSLDVEAMLRRDIAIQLGLAMDKAALYGDGTANAPIGIKNVVGIHAVPFAAAKPTYAELVSMETEVAASNADVEGMAYIINARTKGYAKTTKKFAAAADSAVLWEPGNTLNGYNAIVSNQIANDEVFFGNFADLLIGMWGGLEILADPYTGGDKGRIQIVAMQDVDFAVRRPESFSFGKMP